MFRIALCDDDADALQTAEQLCSRILEEAGIDAQISPYQDSRQLLADLEQNAEFDMLLLDVMMDGLDGMALAKALRKRDSEIPIVFMSSYREMAMQGYHVSALRFLAKPLDPVAAREALLFCYDRRVRKQELLLNTDDGQRRIDCSELMYAEAWNRGTRLWTTLGQIQVRQKFSDLVTQLPERDFVMCHRAYAVNLKYIRALRRDELDIRGGKTIPVSKYRADEVERRFVDYLAQ